MWLQPGCQRRACAFGQQVDWPPSGHVDQQRAVDVSLAQRDIVDAQHTRAGYAVGLGQCPHLADQGVAADRDGELARHAGAGSPGQRKAERFELFLHRSRESSVRAGQARYLLGEGDRRAGAFGALEPTHPHDDAHRPARQRHIGQRALVTTVCT
jgi:hypothetical protein